MSRYAKALAALLGAVGTWGVTAAEDGSISLGEWFGVLVALSTALAVYSLPNRPPAGEDHDPTVSEQDPHAVPDAGLTLVAVALLVVGVLLIGLGAVGLQAGGEQVVDVVLLALSIGCMAYAGHRA